MSTSTTVSSLAYNTTLDDQNGELKYTGPWTALTNATTGWYGNTLTYCGGSGTASSWQQACEMRLTANATWFAVYGYIDSRQGVFSCRLEYETTNGTVVPGTLPWAWYDGAHTNGARTNPIALCSAYNLPLELYTLVVTVQPDQVYQGLGVDSVTYADLVATPGGANWFSIMNPAVPPSGLRNTTASPMLPPSTSIATTSSLPTSLQHQGGTPNGLGIGLGLGLGGLLAILAVVGAWYLFRLRRRASSKAGTPSQRSTSLHSLSWTPSMHSLRSSTIESPATGSSTCLWLGGPNASSATIREHDEMAHRPSGSSRPGAQTPDFTIVESSHGPFDDKYAASEASAAGTYGSNYHDRSSMGPPPVIITPASDSGTLDPSPFDDPVDTPSVHSPTHSRHGPFDDLDLDAPLEHPDSFKPR
ncbi:hypothetical protein JCM3774_004869 [Rhodotorula dairenensis]